MEVFAPQVTDLCEPWGWETVALLTSEAAAREIFEAMKVGLAQIYEARVLPHELSCLRLVAIEVYETSEAAGLRSSLPYDAHDWYAPRVRVIEYGDGETEGRA